MKKKSVLLGLSAAFLATACLASCSQPSGEASISHAEYLATKDGETVVVEAYIQAKQSWWSADGVGQATFYLQDDNGGYLAYNLACTEDDYNTKLTVGTKIQIKGQKSTWSGEVEIAGDASAAEATYKILDTEKKTYKATNVTQYVGTDALVDYQNMFVSMSDFYVVAQNDGVSPFYYKWDNSGSQADNSDLYVSFSNGTATFTACVESYLCNNSSAVYKAVEALKVGDIVNLEGFLYWYNGAQPHLTTVTKTGSIFTKSAGTNTYAEYIAAEDGTTVTVEAFVQAKQSWWSSEESSKGGYATLYLDDYTGAYFVYNLECSEAEYNTFTTGTKLKITGQKSTWSGEVEIAGNASAAEATFEVLTGKYVAQPRKISTLTATLLDYENQLVSLNELTVTAQADGTSAVYYKWDNSGSQASNSDLYFNVTDGTNNFTFVVESYLCDNKSAVYKAVEALKVGDKVTLEGFMYWYNGAQLHTTKITVK